jgi:hypothetical protein
MKVTIPDTHGSLRSTNCFFFIYKGTISETEIELEIAAEEAAAATD